MIKLLKTLSGQKRIFPLYHSVSDKPLPHVRHLYRPKTIQQFRRDLDFYLKNYRPADFPEILEKRDTFFLTFDDGMSQCAEIIAPELLRKGIPACFFINPDFTDNRALFYKHKVSLIIEKLETAPARKIKQLENLLAPDKLKPALRKLKFTEQKTIDRIAETLNIDFQEFLQKEKPYMSLTQIKKLHEKGFRIGAHSINHPLYSEISEDEQFRQSCQSIEFIHENISSASTLFAFPFTDTGVKASLFYKLKKKYPKLFSFGTAGIKKDEIPFSVQRIAVERTEFAGDYIRKQYFHYLAKRILNKNRIKRS